MNIQKLISNGIETVQQLAAKNANEVTEASNATPPPSSMDGLRALASYNYPKIKSPFRNLIGKFNLNDELPVPNKKIDDFSEISPDNIILTHLTHYLPEKGIIRTSLDAGGINRNTIHFAFNHSVTNPLGAGGPVGWTDCEYSILIPFKKAISQKGAIPYGGRHNDFLFVNNLDIPKGSFIVRQNKNLQDGIIEFIEAEKVLDGYTGKEIGIIETNMTPYDATDILVEKLGYSNLKKMHAEGMGQTMEQINLANDIEALMKKVENLKTNEDWDKFAKECGTDFDTYDVEKNENFTKYWNKIWSEFCKKYGYENCLDVNTIFAKNTQISEIIGLLDEIESGWKFQDFDCKQKIIEALESLQKDSRKELLPYDPKAILEIVQSSKTPTEASQRLLKSLNLNTHIDKASKTDKTTIEAELERTIGNLSSEPDENFFFNF